MTLASLFILSRYTIFFNIEVCCVFSLELPHRGDSNENTKYTIFSIKKKENHPKLSKNLFLLDFSKGLKNEFETAMVNEQSGMNCEEVDCEEMNFNTTDPTCSKLQNSDILKYLDKELSHLDQTQRDELKILILEYEHSFPDIPTRIDKIYHGVDIEGSKPFKQHPYRMNPMKLQYLREEISIFVRQRLY